MGISLVKGIGAASEAKTLSEEEILATLATCKCGEIYEQFMRCADGKIRKRGVCPDCQRGILDKARAQRGPGAPRMTAAKRAKIAVEQEKLEAENMTLKERLEKAKAEALAAAERGVEAVVPEAVVAAPAHVKPEAVMPVVRHKLDGVIELDLRPYPTLLEEIKILAIEDVRSIEEEAIWILQDYAKTVRAISKDVLEKAKLKQHSGGESRECRYRD
jgi:hypothetical protein